MSDEHLKLVAKVQHFYELLQNRVYKLSDELVIEPKNIAIDFARDELALMHEEYSKIFGNFIYKEDGKTNEK